MFGGTQMDSTKVTFYQNYQKTIDFITKDKRFNLLSTKCHIPKQEAITQPKKMGSNVFIDSRYGHIFSIDLIIFQRIPKPELKTSTHDFNIININSDDNNYNPTEQHKPLISDL